MCKNEDFGTGGPRANPVLTETLHVTSYKHFLCFAVKIKEKQHIHSSYKRLHLYSKLEGGAVAAYHGKAAF